MDTNESGNSCGAAVATTLYTNAAPVPRLISVHMLGLRLSTERAPRTKKGAPAHSTTGSDRPSSSQLCAAMSMTPSAWPNMASVVTAMVSGRVHVKRRWKSTSSGFASSSRLGSSGSSAMPHLGQVPGWSCRTSGSIGQVYQVPAGAEGGGVTGSVAAGGVRYLWGSARNLMRHFGLQK
jgi:hypothetical protein